MKKKVRVLTLDGGGIRGVIPATIIKYIEDYLGAKSPGTKISDHFDYISGTSTGGILTGLYLAPDTNNPKRPRYSSQEALDFYVKHGNRIFTQAKRPNWKRLWGLGNATQYYPEPLEELLEEAFGDTLMSELIKPFLITTYDLNQKSPFFFTNMDDKSKREFYVRDILRSTSAAPTYYPPIKVKNVAPNNTQAEMLNIDGGVFANNPIMCAYAELRNTDFVNRNNKYPSADDMYILSIGNGGGNFDLKEKENIHRWSLIRWASTIPNIMTDGAIDTTHYQMEQISKTLQKDSLGKYLRIDPPNQKEFRNYSADIADASDENIQNLIIAGERTLEYYKENGLNEFLDGLIDE